MASSPVDETVLVLGCGAELVADSANLHGARTVICDRWQEGQSASLACGLAALDGAGAAGITLGDQPRMSPEAIPRGIGSPGPGASARRARHRGVCRPP